MSLSVHDVLLLPGLQAMRLRAGRAGEHHTVRWPYVAENASITEWVRGGELVFVTGINQPRDEANLRQLVQEAHARGCAGLVVLTGPLFIHGIPDSVLAEADRLAVPLIEQPYDLPMVVVTEAIGSALVQAQWLGSSRQQLIEQLLDASLVDATVLAHRAERLSIDLHRPRQVLVLQLDGTAALFHAQAPDAAEARLQAFRQPCSMNSSSACRPWATRCRSSRRATNGWPCCPCRPKVPPTATAARSSRRCSCSTLATGPCGCTPD